jgi:translation initiation factor 3 subunit M
LGSCTRKPKTAARESYRLKIKALGTFDKGNSDSGVDIAAQVISEFLASKDLYSFDFFQNPVVQALKSSPEHKALFEMLDAYLNGSVNQFAQFLKNGGAEVISKLGVTEEEATTKMRLLALAGLANNRSSLTFNEVSTSLDIPTCDVEDIIVKAIGKHLLEAKINQLNETVIISKCYSRKFEDEEWKNLQADMKQWRSTIKHILELGADNKAVLAKGFSELQLYA